MTDEALFDYALRMGDSCVILSHRVSEWCGHAPVLEEDIAMANVALDLIGQAQMWLGLAGEIEGRGRSADNLAYLRDAHQYRNLLITEQPNDGYARTLVRQFLFDAWHLPVLRALTAAGDRRVADIAAKAVKESAYHVERSTDLFVRLGDGTDESHARMQRAVDELWPFTGELFEPDATDEAVQAAGIAPDLAAVRAAWDAHVGKAFAEATLTRPADGWMHNGKGGKHTEHRGYILAEMQHLQRTYPGASW